LIQGVNFVLQIAMISNFH